MMTTVTMIPSAEQHGALLRDCWNLIDQLPDSGVLDKGGKPYRARRAERKLKQLEHDPVGLLEYIRGMARRTSDGLDAIVRYDRLDLALETLILDETKIYAPLFRAGDRAAARDKFAQWDRQVAELARDREREDEEADRKLIADMNISRRADGKSELTSGQEAAVLENRRRARDAANTSKSRG